MNFDETPNFKILNFKNLSEAPNSWIFIIYYLFILQTDYSASLKFLEFK